MLIRYPPHSKSQWKNLASYSSNKKTKISVESVQTKIINSFMHMFNVSTLYKLKIIQHQHECLHLIIL